MTAQEAASLYGDFSWLMKMIQDETIVAKVEDIVVAETFFEDIPF